MGVDALDSNPHGGQRDRCETNAVEPEAESIHRSPGVNDLGNPDSARLTLFAPLSFDSSLGSIA